MIKKLTTIPYISNILLFIYNWVYSESLDPFFFLDFNVTFSDVEIALLKFFRQVLS